MNVLKKVDIDVFNNKMEDSVIHYSDVYDTLMQLYGNENWGEKTVLEWRNTDDFRYI